MKDGYHRVVGNFQTADGALQAIRTLREAGLVGATAYSPLHDHDLEDEMARGGKGPVSLFALLGALTGVAVGLSLTIGTSLQQPIMTGGQPIISLPPFLVITFELTILFGVLGTVLGMFWAIRHGKGARASYDSRFSVDRFGLEVNCSQDKVSIARDLLSKAGAEEVRDEKY